MAVEKYKTGDKLKMRNLTTDEILECEVIASDDPRMDKLVLPGDICLWFPDFKQALTYDRDFLDGCCV